MDGVTHADFGGQVQPAWMRTGYKCFPYVASDDNSPIPLVASIGALKPLCANADEPMLDPQLAETIVNVVAHYTPQIPLHISEFDSADILSHHT